MSYGERLKELRIRKGLTQDEMANLLNIKRPAYTKYETNFHEPDFEKLIKLSNIFNVSIDYIVRGKEFDR